jgi:hypothetical protein
MESRASPALAAARGAASRPVSGIGFRDSGDSGTGSTLFYSLLSRRRFPDIIVAVRAVTNSRRGRYGITAFDDQGRFDRISVSVRGTS